MSNSVSPFQVVKEPISECSLIALPTLTTLLLMSVFFVDPKFMSQRSLFTKIIFAYFVIAVTKMRYYYAWTFG